MARFSRRTEFLLAAILFHFIYMGSIFDVYFVSPIVSGMRAFSVEQQKAPAKRLVLYVGDGLRADKAFQYFPDPSAPPNDPAGLEPRPMAPYLRSRVLEHGTFGVSHTRVPTESRPGHVALIAGLYEDVSSVTTGWKMNPVNFDSVFNRSSHTWSWGSPDILPMFSTGAVPGRVTDHMYSAEMEDFSKDALELDIWVFNGVKDLFERARTDAALNAQLRQDKVVFFLHLLGLDTTGHYYRPYSREYLHNIQVVDQGVKEVTELIEDFYADGETAFVFTADHGMSDWGSHGDGHPDNTRTPLIAWGAGVRKPVKAAKGIASGHEDGFSSDWNLDKIQRNDVAQADVAILMAYLAGLEYPVNSVGELPLAFLDATEEQKAKAMLVNARQILEMYRVKGEKKAEVVYRYKPYFGFADEEHSPAHQLALIEQAIQNKQYTLAIEMSDRLMQVGLQGLRYLQTYDWLFLRALITLGYLGWIAYSFTTAISLHVLNDTLPAKPTFATRATFGAILAALAAFIVAQRSPPMYAAYAAFTVKTWEWVFEQREALYQAKKKLFGDRLYPGAAAKFAMNLLAYVAILELMVQSYYKREVYTVCYLIMSLWPAMYGLSFLQSNIALCCTWALGCVSMSVFTLLPANKLEDLNLISIGGLLILLVGLAYLAFEKSLFDRAAAGNLSSAKQENNTTSRMILGVQVGLVALAMIVTRSSVEAVQGRKGLPLGNQMAGWFTLVISLVLPFLHALNPQTSYLHRLTIIFLSLGPTFIILTISYEGLFFFAIALTLLSWVRLEHRIFQTFSSTDNETQPQLTSKSLDITTPLAPAASAAAQREKALESSDYRSLTLSDARICLFFLFLLQSAFFSTGNIASVSSFSLEAVSRLLPVFDPFSQGALLILKLLAPFVLVSANLGILTKRLRLRGGSLFTVVMGIGDYLTLRFFWEVRDEGSWLDIGESISMFIIASVLCIFVALLEALSELFTRGVKFEDAGSVVASAISTVTAPVTGSTGSTPVKANGKASGKASGAALNGSASKKNSKKSAAVK